MVDPGSPVVLLDARMVERQRHGIAAYALGLARALKRVTPWRPVLLVGPDTPADVREEFTHVVSPVRFLHPAEVAVLPAVVDRVGARVFHATSFSCSPLLAPPFLLTLHDAIHLERPGDYGLKQALYYRAVVTPAAHAASAVITVSHAAAASLVAHLHLKPSHVQVVHNGVEPAFLAAPAQPRDGPILAVTGPKPHKNLLTLLHALRHAPELRLQVAGVPLPGLVDTAASLGLGHRVEWLGAINAEKLLDALCRARLLAFPSTTEGFGLPPLEAMATGCPVVVSDIPVLHEVAGECGSYVPPLDPVAWARSLRELWADAPRREALGAAGKARAAEFTWDRTAQATALLYEAAARLAPRP